MMSTSLKELVQAGRRLERALADHGRSESAKAEVRSEEAMAIALLYRVYPKEPQWGFHPANWKNGGAIRKLVDLLDRNGVLKAVLPSCTFIRSPRLGASSQYFFHPKKAAKREADLGL